MKTYKCHIDLDGFRKTATGKSKVWRTDAVDTFCCSMVPVWFVWERATQYNDYYPYTGYIDPEHIKLINRAE